MITRLLILINVLAFLWELSIGGMSLGGAIPQNSPILGGMLWPLAVTQHHQYYRLITTGFLHQGLLHIAVNMFSLFMVGRFIEAVLGSPRMLIVYMGSLLAASLGVVYFSAPDVPTLGASGAIFGLLGALFAFGLKLGERGRELVRANIGILILNLVITFSVPIISWQAHVGGLIAGFLLTLLIFWPPQPVRTRVFDPATGAEYESQLES